MLGFFASKPNDNDEFLCLGLSQHGGWVMNLFFGWNDLNMSFHKCMKTPGTLKTSSFKMIPDIYSEQVGQNSECQVITQPDGQNWKDTSSLK